MKARFLLLVLLLAALAAGCGGGGGPKLSADDIAVVGETHILKGQLDALLAQAKLNLKARGQTFPKAGTTAYAGLKTQAMTLLVQEAERSSEATKLGLAVTAKEVEKNLDKQKKLYFNGSDAKYKAYIKKQGVTDAEVRHTVKNQLIATKLYAALTKKVSVTPGAVTVYCAQNQSECAPTRAVRYLLVGKNKTALAQTLFQQLDGANDATWCTLVRKYSQDTGSKATCGKTQFTQGLTVPEFDKLLFSLKTNKVAKVNSKQYGWFVLQPTAAIKKTGATTIATKLLTQKKDAFMTDWVDKTQTSYCKGKITYRVGYAPSPDPCATLTTTTTTTTAVVPDTTTTTTTTATTTTKK